LDQRGLARITLSRGFNEWSLGEEDAGPFFKQAVELGITFWDTANVYQLGSSEELVGRAIKVVRVTSGRSAHRQELAPCGAPVQDGTSALKTLQRQRWTGEAMVTTLDSQTWPSQSAHVIKTSRPVPA
jgi:predicted aldo/keto reductase-like oxidoreductase